MKRDEMMRFRVCVDRSLTPPVYGIEHTNEVRAPRLSTDYFEVERLVRACNRNDLSPCHLWDVVADFRHS